MKALLALLTAAFFILLAGLYAGIGWVTAWILDAGLDVNVNYEIFVWAGLGLFVLCLIPILFFAGLTKMTVDSVEKDLNNIK